MVSPPSDPRRTSGTSCAAARSASASTAAGRQATRIRDGSSAKSSASARRRPAGSSGARSRSRRPRPQYSLRRRQRPARPRCNHGPRRPVPPGWRPRPPLARAARRPDRAQAARRLQRPGRLPGIRSRPGRRHRRPARWDAPARAGTIGPAGQAMPTRCVTSSSKPSMPITGVGSTAWPAVSLYRLTLPLTTGVRSASHAATMPSTARPSDRTTSGRSGLPKFRQSVTASGSAPTQTVARGLGHRLRAALVGVKPAEAGVAIGGQGQPLRVPLIRSTAASAFPGARTVLVPMVWS